MLQFCIHDHEVRHIHIFLCFIFIHLFHLCFGDNYEENFKLHDNWHKNATLQDINIGKQGVIKSPVKAFS